MVEFNRRNPQVFSNNAKMTSGFASLEADIATLEHQGALRITSKGMRSDGTRDKSAAGTALYALVRKASNTGKLIKKEEPDFDNQFKTRRGNMSSAELLDTARGFVTLLTAGNEQKMSDFGSATVNAANTDPQNKAINNSWSC